MTSITQRKADLKDIILRRIKNKLEANDIDYARGIALGACERLAASMTLNELQDWNLEMTMAMPSRATAVSAGMTPCFWASFFSFSVISLEEAQISVVPFIRAAMPVPEPPPVTDISISGCFFINASAQFVTR